MPYRSESLIRQYKVSSSAYPALATTRTQSRSVRQLRKHPCRPKYCDLCTVLYDVTVGSTVNTLAGFVTVIIKIALSACASTGAACNETARLHPIPEAAVQQYLFSSHC